MLEFQKNGLSLPQFAAFQPGSHQHNLELFRLLVEGIPEQPLEAPVKKTDPAFALQRLLFKFVEEKSGLSEDYFYVSDPEGAGLSTQKAVDCLKDTVRTKRFLQAIDSFVQKLAEGKDQIRVLDAGCGPMAVLGIFAALVSDKVSCTCLEMNKASAAFANTVVGVFGLSDRVRVVNEDATKYKPENGETFDLIISETMYTAFIGEPIIQIFSNLASYLSEDGLTLPSSIDYKIGFLASDDPSLMEQKLVQFGAADDCRQWHNLDSWESYFSWKPGDALNEIKVVYPLPADSTKDYYCYVGTTVSLGDFCLDRFDSNISYPLPLTQCGSVRAVKGGSQRFIATSYKPGSRSVNPSMQILDKNED